MKGWISLHRKLQENPIWTSEPFTRGQAWVDLLLLANHERGYIYVRDHKIEVKRGQVGWSQNRLSNRWQWSRTKVRKFLQDLEKEQQIRQQKSHSYTIIDIINYDEYQSQKQEKRQQEDNRKTTGRQQKDTNNNDNNDNNDNKKTLRQEIFEKNSDAVEVADYLLEKIVYWKPSHRYKNRKHASGSWCQTIERAMRIDGRTREQLEFVIDYIFTQSTEVAEFWAPNIQSAYKLREKFDQLVSKIRIEYKRRKKNGKITKQQISQNARQGFQSLNFDD